MSTASASKQFESMTPGRLRRALLVGVASTVAGTALLSGTPSSAEPLAALSVTAGLATVTGPGTIAVVVRRTRGLEAFDTVVTSPSGTATITYFDGSTTRLAPATSYTVRELHRLRGARQIVGHLEVGQTWHRVTRASESGSRFEVATANAVAAVRGTVFAVQCTAGGPCSVEVVSGRVEVREPEGVVVAVSPGERIELKPRSTPRRAAKPRSRDAWVTKNSTVDRAIPPPGPMAEKNAAKPVAERDDDDDDEGTGERHGERSGEPKSEPRRDEDAEDQGVNEDGKNDEADDEAGDDARKRSTTTTQRRASTSSTTQPPRSTTTTQRPRSTTTTRDTGDDDDD